MRQCDSGNEAVGHADPTASSFEVLTNGGSALGSLALQWKDQQHCDQAAEAVSALPFPRAAQQFKRSDGSRLQRLGRLLESSRLS